uniref:PHD-type domain-containing protein n=1 Tax=Seriola lalandi dorsalis TaxID=1841481 RepID=A0A3B4WD20_SERLL
PIIVIKDDPFMAYWLQDFQSFVCGFQVQNNQRASLPDSTGEHPQISPPSRPWDQSKIKSLGGEEQVEQNQARLGDSDEVLCAVCQSGGELLCCDKCLKVFHLTCHVPSLLKSPSREWFCSFCRDLFVPEMEYDCDSKPEAKTVKKECLFLPLQKCERLLLHLFCSDLSSNFQEPTIKRPMNLSTVKKRLEAKQSLCYRGTAEFVSDIRLLFGNCAALSETVTEVTVAGRKLMELFEEHLRIIFSDQTFAEIKVEMIPTAPPYSQVLSLDNIPQPAKRKYYSLNTLQLKLDS